VPPTHLSDCCIALLGRCVPVQTMPLRSQELTHGIFDWQAYAYPERLQFLNRRRAQVLSLADTHGLILISGVHERALAFVEHALVVLHDSQALV
jgi:hypothetical protein